MAEEDSDPERLLRVSALVKAVQDATDGQIIGDVQMAFANAIGLMCLRQEDPENLFLITQEVLSEVFRAMRKHVSEGKTPEVLSRNVN